jgi:hypothetical protein
VFLAALVLVCAVFHSGELRKNWLKFCIAGGLFVLATVPYSVYYRIWYRPDIIAREIWYVRKLTLMWWNFRDLNLLGVMPWMGAVGLFCFMLYYRKQEKHIRMMLEWVVVTAGYALLLGLLSPQAPEATQIADLRYLVSILPFLAGATGMFIWFVHQKTRVGAIVILAIIVTTNLPSVTPRDRQLKWLLPAYVNEIHHNYPTAYGEVVRFLGENAQQDEKVFAWPECTNFPLMFYLGEKVKMSCLLTSLTTLPPAKIRELNAPLTVEENFPDWIIFSRLLADGKKLLEHFSRVHIEEMREVQFNYRLVKVLDIYGDDTTRPELSLHSFGPKTDYNRKNEAVYVFKKIGN